jgi:hypothetical protein
MVTLTLSVWTRWHSGCVDGDGGFHVSWFFLFGIASYPHLLLAYLFFVISVLSEHTYGGS